MPALFETFTVASSGLPLESVTYTEACHLITRLPVILESIETLVLSKFTSMNVALVIENLLLTRVWLTPERVESWTKTTNEESMYSAGASAAEVLIVVN